MRSERRLAILSVVLAGYLLIFGAALGLGWFSFRGLDQLGTITRDLYVHPFAVSNAAADMKGSLFQMRNHVVQLVLIKNPHDHPEQLRREIDQFDALATNNLEVIKANYLGDMSEVRDLEARLDQWRGIRSEILAALQNGDYARAEHLVKEVGTPEFSAIVPLVDGILTFARNKGQFFAEEAEARSESIAFQVVGLFIALLVGIAATAGVVMWRVRDLHAQLDRQATTDFLTGVPNRRHFLALTQQENDRSRRSGSLYALAVVDLDHFKNINDVHGHHIGDLALKAFCEVGRKHLRLSDVLGRIGGEEFAILLPNTSLTEAQQVIERVRHALEETEIQADKVNGIRVTASFGLTVRLPTDDEVDRLLQRADASLYRAKAGGRNRICVQDEPDHAWSSASPC